MTRSPVGARPQAEARRSRALLPAALLLALGLAAGACGRYGPPVRPIQPKAPVAAPQPTPPPPAPLPGETFPDFDQSSQ